MLWLSKWFIFTLSSVLAVNIIGLVLLLRWMMIEINKIYSISILCVAFMLSLLLIDIVLSRYIVISRRNNNLILDYRYRREASKAEYYDISITSPDNFLIYLSYLHCHLWPFPFVGYFFNCWSAHLFWR